MQRQQRNFLLGTVVAGNFATLVIGDRTIASNPYGMRLLVATLRTVAASLPTPQVPMMVKLLLHRNIADFESLFLESQ